MSDDKQHLYTNLPGCLKQMRESECTHVQPDAHLNRVSTRCWATIDPPMKPHSNVVVLAG